MQWFPLHSHTFFSLLDGLSKPDQIAERLVECGYAGSAVSDHASLAGVPSVIKACNETCKCGHQKRVHYNGDECSKKGCVCKKFDKHKLKAIAGCEFNLSKQDASIRNKTNAKHSHLVVLAKGQQGWVNLIKAASESNKPENFYRKPRLSLDKLASFSRSEWITFSGHMGSDLADICFAEPKLAYNAKTYEEARTLVRKDWKEAVTGLIQRYQGLFGKDNFFIEIQLVDHVNLPASLVVARILRHVAKQLDVPRVATADSHYPRKQDAEDQRVLLCAALETTLQEVERKLDNDEEVGLGTFFKSNNYHIPSLAEMEELHRDEPDELANAVLIASRCETPKIANKPMLPAFPCPDGMTSSAYLRQLCDEGFQKKIVGVIPDAKVPEYQKQLDKEIGVLTDTDLDLPSYFLIVQDFIEYARKKLKCLVGKGRGSAAGCLVSYLLDITRVDPIKFGLLFERFFSYGRNVPSHVSFAEAPFDKFTPVTKADAKHLQGSITGRILKNPDSPHRAGELSLLMNSRVCSYYKHVFDNVELDRSNPQNSYIMWALGKVDLLDESKSCVIQEGRTSLPDIDSDFPIGFRDLVLDYLRGKYGEDRVCQMATFARMQGRGAMKDVLRAHGVSFEEMNRITEHIPDESEISGHLQEMLEETGEASIIRWALENLGEYLKEWCHIDEQGELAGPLALRFAQAIRLEGTKRSQGKHASGVIVSSVPLSDIVPMVYDKSSEKMMVGVDMRDAEEMGLVKFDLLALRTLNCLMDAQAVIRTGRLPR